MKKTNKKGFTLVELVIVIAVIAILAGVMIATFSNVVSKANASADLQEIKSMLDAQYYDFIAENGTPATLELNGNGEFIAFSTLTFGVVPQEASSTSTVTNEDGSKTKTVITFAKAAKEEKNSFYDIGAVLKKTTAVSKKAPGDSDFGTAVESIAYYDYVATITGKNGTEFRVILIANSAILQNVNNTLDDGQKIGDEYVGSFYIEQID